LTSLMRPQKHLGPSLPPALVGRKRVGLHYIAFLNLGIEDKRLVTMTTLKIAEFNRTVTNFG
ncbi:MAG: hypothetical protein DMG65_10380, partial [Candidatus Angelobacter sp. Gp1-AA117]